MTLILYSDTKTCLSHNVKKYFEFSICEDNDTIVQCFSDSDILKINFDVILDKLGDSSDEECLASLIPVLHKIHLEFREYLDSPDAKHRIKERVGWKSQPEHVQLSVELHHQDIANNSNESCIQNLLVLTSVLERSLADVLLSSGRVQQVPALLRDLLCEKELQEILGTSCVRFMKLLVGSPKTLNLRNLVWHGFVFPGEIHPMFVTVIILLITTIGDHLQTSHIELRKRTLITDWRLGELTQLPRVSPTDHIMLHDVEALLSASEIFFKRNIPPFLRIYSLMTSGHPGQACVLLLPMIETLMRWGLFCD